MLCRDSGDRDRSARTSSRRERRQPRRTGRGVEWSSAPDDERAIKALIEKYGYARMIAAVIHNFNARAQTARHKTAQHQSRRFGTLTKERARPSAGRLLCPVGWSAAPAGRTRPEGVARLERGAGRELPPGLRSTFARVKAGVAAEAHSGSHPGCDRPLAKAVLQFVCKPLICRCRMRASFATYMLGTLYFRANS